MFQALYQDQIDLLLIYSINKMTCVKASSWEANLVTDNNVGGILL